MTLANLLHDAAERFADRAAVNVGTETHLTYGQLSERVGVLAGRLRRDFGLERGDRVALAMKNTPEYIELLYAAWHAGLAVVPMNAKLHAREFDYILDHSGARVCFASPALFTKLAASEDRVTGLERVVEVGAPDYLALLEGPPLALRDAAPEDLAWLFYTSGTTGRPKGAALSHRNLLAMVEGYFASVDRIEPGDGLVHCAPMSHGSGMYIMCHTTAGGVQIIPPSGGFDEDEFFDLLAGARGVTLFAAPTMVKRLSEHPRAGLADTRNLKTIVYGGGPMYLEDLLRAQETFGYKFAQIYGQGESPMTITAMDRATHRELTESRRFDKLNSAGLPQSPVEVAIFDGEGEELPRGRVGEIAVRGDTVMLGYWRDEEATGKAILENGWLLTGDVGKMGGEGYVTLTDRSKDVIISGGTNVYPREVEEVLLRHPHVREASVVGRADPDWGEVIVAFVVGEGLDAERLDAFCLDHMARFKRPREYRFLEELPKNNYGKILKTELRRLL